jgi:dihydrofolate synthase/folylpolyglutamate synthase
VTRTLAEWLAFQERLHPLTIDLSLARVHAVLARLGLERPPFTVLTVAGTNGKGSCVAWLEAILLASGRRVGAYTSPHLERYNERVRIAGREADDATLCAAFARVEAARGAESLTYFEYGTLGAVVAFAGAGIEVAVLEVGLGGRLDAVNALDARAAAITSIDIDHQDLLGPDRESIGGEKAGVFRTGRPAICGDADPPASIASTATARGARLWQRDRDFRVRRHAAHWDLEFPGGAWRGLPPPALAGDFQYANAATALALLASMADELPVSAAAIATGLSAVQHPGRLERIPGPVEVILDVAHNPHAARALASHLAATTGAGRTLLVIGMYADKDAPGVATALAGQVHAVHAGGLDGPRGQSGAALLARLAPLGVPGVAHADVTRAFDAALGDSRAGDRIVVCGSFATVGAVRSRGVYSRPH